MVRFVFYLIILALLVRALARLWEGFREGLSGGVPRVSMPQHGVQMVRDPVCGTFVVPNRALSLSARGHQLFFCSTTCRDKYVRGAVRDH
jgi:YHS domain-containing protein